MIKRLLWLVVALVSVVRSANAQQGLQGYVVTGTGAQARIVLTGSAIVFHQLTWNVTGTVSSCTVALDTSADGVSWSAGNAIAGQTCTSNGQSALSTSAVFNFVRVNTTAFSGTGSVVITWAGYVATPGGLPTGCTSPGTGAITCTGTVTANIGSFNSEGTNFTDIACGAQSVGNANQVRASCDGTNWPVWSMNGIAAAKAALSMGVNAQTVSYLAVQSDCGKLITMNGVSLTFTLPAAIINSACVFDVKNLAATSLTISRNGLNVDGAAANPTALAQNQSYRITNDGAGYWTEALMISAAAPVSSVFSRTGAVVAAANDYTLDQIGNPVANATFQPTVDATVLFKQFNGTNALDIFGVQTKTAAPVFHVQSGGVVRIGLNDTCAITSTAEQCPIFVIGGNGTIQSSSGHTIISDTAPTISSGFGTSPSVTVNNGTASFRINVGTGGVASTGVIGLPAATNGWNCSITNLTTQSATVDTTRQTGAGTTTTVPIGNFTSGGLAGAWTASDILAVICFGL